jgi:hypothetical protein
MGLVIQDKTYAGEVLAMFIALAATSFDTLEKGCIAVLPGIKKKQSIPSISVKGFIQARDPKPKHSGSATIGARTLEPKDFMGYLEFNPRDFEAHWSAVKMNPKLLDAQLPKDVESAIVQEVIKLNKSFLDIAVWQSIYDEAAIASALTNGLTEADNNLIFFDGLMKKMLDDAKVIKVDGVVLTEDNIFAEMKKVKLKRPKAIKNHPNGKYLVSYNTAELFENAQQAQNYKGANVTEAGKMTFGGQPVVALAGVPDDVIVYCIASTGLDANLWLGINELDEEEYLKLDRLQANSELFFIKMLYKIDVNHAWGEQTVLYRVPPPATV